MTFNRDQQSMIQSKLTEVINGIHDLQFMMRGTRLERILFFIECALNYMAMVIYRPMDKDKSVVMRYLIKRLEDALTESKLELHSLSVPTETQPKS